MGRSRTNSTGDGLKSLLYVDNQAALDGRNIDPFAIFVENLKSARAVLRQECKQPGRVFVWTNALRVRGGLWIFDELQAAHVALEIVKGIGRQRQTFGDQVDKVLGQRVYLGNVFLHKMLSARIVRILSRC